MNKQEIEKFLTYNGIPLVRVDNIIYYGKINQKCIAKIEIKNFEENKDLKISNELEIQILDHRDRVLKSSEKNNLYLALDLAKIWLERILEGS
ncbi:MAG: hypothetical protein RsTaC01_0723 [Candidatus Paraimprobicoccus trichonymphae]|uniref:Uncharacterized protein n=1 Tax=Candidatus Paraimprobicoccus trichonymphae TaxID=3033793 RepID=A0AA48KZF0_9FIRM|nr:MAG: hypothetical protein RsTaC01_0723 [Candidatus Paraimprobicoccus trichonymphae]